MVGGKVKPIPTKAEYEAALLRIDALMDAESGSPESEELDVLADLVEIYENEHVPMGYPGPVGMIEFYLDQRVLSPSDLIPIIGSRTKVAEVRSGKRTVTRQMAQALHEHFGIPLDALLYGPGGVLGDPPIDQE